MDAATDARKINVSANRYLPSPLACERLDQLVARHGGTVISCRGETRVDYALPVQAAAEVRDFLAPETSATFEPASIAQLPGGRVFGSGNVLSPDGRVIARDVSPDLGKAFADHWLLTFKKITPPVPLSGTTAVIAVPLGAGYGHWLLDELPRLLALEINSAATIIAQAARAYHREVFTLHGFTGKVLPAKRLAHFACEQLIVPSLGQLTPITVRILDEFTAPLRDPSVLLGERLYVSRDKARRRRVANEPELWAQLAARGFVKVHLEELTWRQQINAFRCAKIIVAPHGAGLANLVFCQAGTKVIELFHRSYVNGCYWQLAALKALDYRPVVSPGSVPLTQTLSENRADIEADVTQVLRAL